MGTEELDNLNRNELFEELKDECKSIAKRDFYGGLIALALVVLLLIFAGQRLDDPRKIFNFSFWIVFACLWGVWLIPFDYRIFKKNDNLDTPDRLLNWFEKRHRFNLIAWVVFCIFIIGSILVEPGFELFDFVGVAIGVAIIAIIFFCGGGPLWYRKEKDIIEQLRELVDKK